MAKQNKKTTTTKKKQQKKIKQTNKKKRFKNGYKGYASTQVLIVLKF